MSLRDLEKEGSLSEDERHRAEDDVQELTDKYIEIINQLRGERRMKSWRYNESVRRQLDEVAAAAEEGRRF